MSDVGSVVGVISLTLQLLQGLKKYYTEFRSFHDDIDVVIQRTERIEAILHVLERPVEKLWRDDDELSEEVKKCMKLCESAVSKLKFYQEKCSEADHRPEKLRRKLVLVKQRALYPFRKDTLQDLHKQLGWMHDNLQTVLQALGLDASIRQNDAIMSKATTMLNDLSLVRHRQSYQTELLEVVDQRSQNHMVISSHHFSRAEERSEAQMAHLSSLEEKLDGLTSAVGRVLQTARISPPLPSELRKSCDQYVSIVQDTKNYASHQHLLETKRRSVIPGLECTCTGTSRRRQVQPSRRWLNLFSKKQYEHLSPCPFSIPSQRKRIAGLQLRLCRGALGYLIEMSLSWSTTSIMPSMKITNIVPDNSPAMALISCLRQYVYAVGKTEIKPREFEILHVLELTNRSLVELFKMNRAGVSDMTSCEENLAHAYLTTLGSLLYWDDFASISCGVTQSVVLFLRKLGVDLNLLNRFERTPTTLFLQNVAFYSAKVLKTHLSEFQWQLVFQDMQLSFRFLELHDEKFWVEWMNINVDESIVPGWMHQLASSDDLLAQALIQKSTQKLEAALDSGERRFIMSMSHIPKLALQWPDGLDMILRSRTKHRLGPSILGAAIQHKRRNLVKYLTQEIGITPYLNSWFFSICTGDSGIMSTIASTLYQRLQKGCLLRRLNHEPEKRYSFSELSNILWGFAIGYYMHHDGPSPGVYLTNGDSEILFKTGFTDLNVVDPSNGPVIWYFISNLYLRDVSHRNCAMERLEWMVRHGADIHAVHPVWQTMSLHLLSEVIVQATFDYGKDYSRHEILCEVLGSEAADQCTCLCAENGCTVISSAIKQASCQEEIIGKPVDLLRSLIQGFETIQSFFPESLYQNVLFMESAIRGLTFNALRLQHTCHMHNVDASRKYVAGFNGYSWNIKVEPDKPLLESEIQDIRYAEQEDIQLFGTLLKEFQAKRSDFGGNITDFIEEIWYPCMEQILLERFEGKIEEEIEALEKIGVVIQSCAPQPVEERIVPFKHGSKEWFEWKVETILDGTYEKYDDWNFRIF